MAHGEDAVSARNRRKRHLPAEPPNTMVRQDAANNLGSFDQKLNGLREPTAVPAMGPLGFIQIAMGNR